MREGVLFGVRFDPVRLEVRGAPAPLLDDMAASATGSGQFDFSSTGTFVYAAGKSASPTWQVARMDASGNTQALATPDTYLVPRLSPDGRNLAFVRTGDIFVRNLERDTSTRLTFAGLAHVPVWAPDSKHLVFQSHSNDSTSFYWTRSDGSGEPQRLLQRAGSNSTPWSLSPDGKRLAYFERNPETGYDIWILPLDVTDPDRPVMGKPEVFLHTSADEQLPRFSPDGRWIAYRSNESGKPEIYVRPFPAGSGGKWQMSTDGGLYALWSNNGRELFYETPDNRIMVLDYTVDGASFVPGKRRLWSERQLFYTGTSNLDLAPDGKRFVVLTLPDTAPGAKESVHVTMLLNFFDEVRRKLP